MPFSELNDHVLGEILAHFDIYHVLNFTQVDKRCRRSALSKQLWISLIRDLNSRGLRDSTAGESLEGYTTQELIEMAKYAACGPKTWAPTSRTPPTLIREVSVLRDSQLARTTPVHLLPGGRYLVGGRAPGLFAVWSVATARLVWTYTEPWILWSLAPLDEGDTIVVIFYRREPTQPQFLELVEVDLDTGVSSLQTRVPLPTKYTSASSVHVRGDFLVVVSDGVTSLEALIINWRTEAFVRLQFPVGCRIASWLVSGYLVVTQVDIDDALSCAVYCLDTLRWDSLTDLSDQSADHEHLPVASLRLPTELGEQVDCFATQPYRHPLRRGAFKIMTIVSLSRTARLPSNSLKKLWGKIRRSDRDDNAAQTRAIVYSFILRPREDCGDPLLGALGISKIPQWHSFSLSFSGYVVYFPQLSGDRVVIFDTKPNGRGIKSKDGLREVLSREHRMGFPPPMLGLYSTALILVEGNLVRILYYA
ncbi:hypothetical protein FB45DRAFT_1063456 [Roridomyces roridus]|uniref:F-box domain-containing protein n=1 Tax=Roridomyces roridus TaxID=1738132 RepID=A0AAD7BDC1_9AGAR|nr:hypothetical protein FB45DRAFT_1063456 [Roridomyces roridus]